MKLTMKAHNVRISHEDPARSLQTAIDDIEAKGHEIVQVLAHGSHAAIILARHERSDEPEQDPIASAPPAPAPVPEAVEPQDPPPAPPTPQPPAKQVHKHKKGGRR